MACPQCGTINKAGLRFCVECGTALAAPCPNCGGSNDPGNRFCGHCGTPLGAGAAPDAGAGATPDGGSAAPSDRRIAERRLVSVLFADLVGFTPYSEGRDAEDVRSMLSRYFELATDIVERYGGTVEKFIGDAVMAVWGTPMAHEDDAERAVRAALELVDIVPTVGEGLAARAGVLTGEAAVTIGAEREGMVIGDIVNTAARLQSAAPEGAVLVGESTYRAASSSIAFEPAGDQTLKGKAAPVPAWRALRIIASRHGAGRPDVPEPPFVGRDVELRALKEALHVTGHDQQPRLVSLTGPGGIGKSRLTSEFENHTDGLVEDIFWHRGRCPAYGAGITFWALGEMVRRRAGLAESDDEATTRARIAETVATYIEAPDDRAWVEPALLTLLGVPSGAATSREVLFAAWRIFFERIAARGTTVLLFEDLQWADSGLLDFIDHLLEWSKGVPLLVITLARPELFDRRADWGSSTRHLTTMTLGPLSDDAMRKLLEGFAGGLPEGAVATIVQRAEGTPLYAVEMIRSLVTDGRLTYIDGAYRPTGDLGTIAVPETLRSLIASRLDALDAADRGLVQDGAVLGQVFTLQGLAAVSGRPDAELEARLRGLIRRELFQLEADPRSPERGQYRFVQALIREVAYATLAKPDRRARHLAAARFLEALGEDELAGALASHYLAAHAASTSGTEADTIAIQARIALRAAGLRASQLGAHDQAVTYFRQALDVATDPVDRTTLLMDAARSADRATHYDLAEAHLREAIATYRTLGDASGAGAAEALLSEVQINDANVTGAMATIDAALAALPDGADEPRARLLASLSRAMYRDDQNARAVEVADQALAIAERLDLEELVVEALINKGAGLDTVGRRRESRIVQEAAIGMAKERGMVGTLLRAMANVSNTVADDDPRAALAIMDEALDLAMRVGDRGMSDWIRWIRATLQIDLGDDWDGPLADMEERVAASETPNAAMRPLFTGSLIRIMRGEPEGEAQFERFAANATHVGDPTALQAVPAARGRVAFAKGEFVLATELFLEAMSAAEWVAEITMQFVVHSAALSRDPDLLRRLIDVQASMPGTVMTKGQRATGAAALAALEGRTTEAIAGFREVLATWDELRVHTAFAFTALDFVALIKPQEPSALAAAEEARVIFGRLGARPFLEMLDAALAGAPSSPAVQGTVPVAS